MWKNISKLVLSKTQSQEITVLALLNNVETPVIIGSNISNIKSTVSDFNDMFENALLKHKEQTVKAKWTFNKLKISGRVLFTVDFNIGFVLALLIQVIRQVRRIFY